MTDFWVNISNCDKEPIHIPGAIQPHGVLFACDATDLRIKQVSENAERMLGVSVAQLPGTSLLEIFAEESREGLRELCEAAPEDESWIDVTMYNGESFVAVVHREQRTVLVELEPKQLTHEEALSLQKLTRRALKRLQQVDSTLELCSIAAQEVRSISGFDRVMVYRFDRDWNGEVVAEEKRDDLEPFLGLHYPASDIPEQARRLYTENWLRFIPDVSYVASNLFPRFDPGSGLPLDMSHSVLRSVSPIHCEYLRNMGVRASMSVSLVVDGKLWGLIACHHSEEPRLIPFQARDAAEFLGQTLSSKVSTLERRELLRYGEAAERLEGLLVEAMVNRDNFLDGLDSAALLSVCDADGAVVLFDGEQRCVGNVPSSEEIQDLRKWVSSKIKDGVFVTDALPIMRATSNSMREAATGLLAIAISRFHGDFILWFRKPYERVVHWAGEPTKTMSVRDGVPRLSPRGSFALWKETVRGRSKPWEPWHLRSAASLRSAILLGLRRLNDGFRFQPKASSGIGLDRAALSAAVEECVKAVAEIEKRIASERLPHGARENLASVVEELRIRQRSLEEVLEKSDAQSSNDEEPSA